MFLTQSYLASISYYVFFTVKKIAVSDVFLSCSGNYHNTSKPFI